MLRSTLRTLMDTWALSTWMSFVIFVHANISSLYHICQDTYESCPRTGDLVPSHGRPDSAAPAQSDARRRGLRLLLRRSPRRAAAEDLPPPRLSTQCRTRRGAPRGEVDAVFTGRTEE